LPRGIFRVRSRFVTEAGGPACPKDPGLRIESREWINVPEPASVRQLRMVRRESRVCKASHSG
jgi:hypothetical protein